VNQERSRRKPALVILAAGESARLGRCKALVLLPSQNPLELLAEAGAGLDEVAPLVVTGADHERIAAALPRGLEILFNPDWRSGRSSGVALAAKARAGFDLCLAPVDVPLVPREVFEALLAAWLEADAPPRGWLAPRLRGRAREERSLGHPVLAGRQLLADLAGLGPSVPLTQLRNRAVPLFSVDVDREEILDDLDTPEDLERILARARG
jgi:molybdenum cofactor cytidylyltransferase